VATTRNLDDHHMLALSNLAKGEVSKTGSRINNPSFIYMLWNNVYYCWGGT